MKQTHILPQIPKGITDPVVEKYLRDLQKVIRDKHEDDYMSSKKGGGGDVGADIIIKYEIEALIIHWCLVDSTQLPAVYQVCDGSVWKSGSYAESFWSPRGLTKIPNLCGYGLRAADRSSTQNDPDRDDRRQAVTGEVLTGGLTVSLPAFYCNVIKEARDKGRTVQIGINSSDMFGTLSPVSTVSNVDLTTNVVTVGTALTVGATALIIKGDCIGSFQRDAMQKITGQAYGLYSGWSSRSGVFYFSGENVKRSDAGGSAIYPAYLNIDSSYSTSPNPAKTSDYETRIKNISYLPVMYVLLPSQALVNINGG
jgi:hypothetical protein